MEILSTIIPIPIVYTFFLFIKTSLDDSGWLALFYLYQNTKREIHYFRGDFI